jgi:CRISPR-associated endonuclease/helicase Cas3
MSEFPSFADFYARLHGRDPFPWQIRLADLVEREGWPSQLDLPTGTGKTSALDIALYTLAKYPQQMPRRILLVVDRRIVVDQGAEHARTIRRKLCESRDIVVRGIKRQLLDLFGGAPDALPFGVAVLRGGAPRDDDWAKRPDQAVLGVSTVDQVGSRLLFQGYGVGHRLASIHAGLLGADTLILLDEVHLSVPFAETLRGLRERYIAPGGGLPDRFRVVEMSATPIPFETRSDERAAPSLGRNTSAARSVFSLDRQDREHPVLKQRLEAKKPARLVELRVRGEESDRREALASAAVEAVVELRAGGAKTIGVVVNRVDTARLVHAQLSNAHRPEEVVLVTGRMRPLDRDHLVEGALGWADASRDRDGAPAVTVVATQCIEAGADLDFDALITELASFDALKQRFGRLDRRGTVTASRGSAPAVVLARHDQLDARYVDPVYGSALAPTWALLSRRAKQHVVDMGSAALAIDAPEGSELEQAVAPHPHAPVMLPGHVDAWSQTSPLLRPDPTPDVALWLHGPERSSPEVQVVWRADLRPADLEFFSDTSASKAEVDRRDAIEESLTQVRPSSLEALPLPIGAAKAWLGDKPPVPVADVPAMEQAEERERRVRDAPLVGLVRRIDRWVAVQASQLRPNDLIVVPAIRGGLAAGSFDPESREPVMDLGDLAQLRGRGLFTLRTRPETLQWLGPLREPAPMPELDATGVEERSRLQDWLQTVPLDPARGCRLRAHEVQLVRHIRRLPRPTVLTYDDGESFVVRVKVPAKAIREALSDVVGEAYSEDDQSSFTRRDASLRQHSTDVFEKARDFAQALHLPKTIVEDVALAAWLHDVGKVDARFQLMLAGGDEVSLATQLEPQAKSRLPGMSPTKWRSVWERSGLPDGYRHELTSLAMIEHDAQVRERAHDLDLVLHLVAAHHGYCRPFAPALPQPTATDPSTLGVELQHQGGPGHQNAGGFALTGRLDHRYGALDGGVVDRFWRVQERYGPWGLAWLEAILRLADHRASEETEEGGNA